MAIFRELLFLLLIDLVFVGVLLLALIPLLLYKHAAFAVLKRNFVGYFSNPTGYVFLCLFVLLSSFAAFWPHEFFTANLANLDQLNLYLPGIMLVFIPAITMSIWSEERRQGTDELLLTLPAGDFDIVIGKYLAAAAIFTASLLFSQISNFTVLLSLAMGDVDLGLFLTTYLGYWLTGLAMMSIGMVASFLTKNLTIGFILGLHLQHAPGVHEDGRRAAQQGESAVSVQRQSVAAGVGLEHCLAVRSVWPRRDQPIVDRVFRADHPGGALPEHVVDRRPALVRRPRRTLAARALPAPLGRDGGPGAERGRVLLGSRPASGST